MNMTALLVEGIMPLEPIVGRVETLTEVTGGLFNRVLRGQAEKGGFYVKQLTDSARSGSFPPLPTTRMQRYAVALAWHEHALACATADDISVPALLAQSASASCIVMAEVDGQPLYDLLVSATGAVGQIEGHLTQIVDWLGLFHQRPMAGRNSLQTASDAFKRYKVGLQYFDLLPLLAPPLRDHAARFTEDYLRTTHDVVHGDLNSRNILVAPPRVAVIDFEQGHLGDGVYDLAYILAEYVICCHVREHAAMETFIDAAWQRYVHRRPGMPADEERRRFDTHLGFQTLYRLVGPSRGVWSGHLDDRLKREVTKWSMKRLARWLQP